MALAAPQEGAQADWTSGALIRMIPRRTFLNGRIDLLLYVMPAWAVVGTERRGGAPALPDFCLLRVLPEALISLC